MEHIVSGFKKGQVIIPTLIIIAVVLVGGVITYVQLQTKEFNENDVSITFCADGQDIIFNPNLNVSWKEGDKLKTHMGGFEESKRTYEYYPECIVKAWADWNTLGRQGQEPTYEVNTSCLLERCDKIVTLNQLNGTITEQWKKGDIW